MDTNEIIITEDESHTLYNSAICEHYHSVHGAIQESSHIYIDAGLKSITKKEIHILEIGFGTGLNALLTMIEAEKSGLKIHYTAIEKFPLQDHIINKLNYCELLKTDKQKFLMMHHCEWDKDIEIESYFTVKKIFIDFKEAFFRKNFDLVYFDLFSPSKQADLWTVFLLRNLTKYVNPSGVFVTYSANGDLKRTLETEKFRVFHLPGPPGKRVFTKAIKL